MSYTFYTAAIAAAVLIAADVPNPSNLAHEGRRILFTLAGVGIAIIVLLLAGLLQSAPARRPKKHQENRRPAPRETGRSLPMSGRHFGHAATSRISGRVPVAGGEAFLERPANPL